MGAALAPEFVPHKRPAGVSLVHVHQPNVDLPVFKVVEANDEVLQAVETVTVFDSTRIVLLNDKQKLDMADVAKINTHLTQTQTAPTSVLSVVLDCNALKTDESKDKNLTPQEQDAVLILDENGKVLARYFKTSNVLQIDHHYEKSLDKVEKGLGYNVEYDQNYHRNASTTPLVLSLMQRLFPGDNENLNMKLQLRSYAQDAVDEGIFDLLRQALYNFDFSVFINHTDSDSIGSALELSSFLNYGYLSEEHERMALTALDKDHYYEAGDQAIVALSQAITASDTRRDVLALLQLAGNKLFPERFAAPERMRESFQLDLESYEIVVRDSLEIANKIDISKPVNPEASDERKLFFVEGQTRFDGALVYGAFARRWREEKQTNVIPILFMARDYALDFPIRGEAGQIIGYELPEDKKPKNSKGEELSGFLYRFWLRSRDLNLDEFKVILELLFGMAGRKGAAANSRQLMGVRDQDINLQMLALGGKNKGNTGYFAHSREELEGIAQELAAILDGTNDKISPEGWLMNSALKDIMPDRAKRVVAVQAEGDLTRNFERLTSAHVMNVTYEDENGGKFEQKYFLRRIEHGNLRDISQLQDILIQQRMAKSVDQVPAVPVRKLMVSKEQSLILYDYYPELDTLVGKKDEVIELWREMQTIPDDTLKDIVALDVTTTSGPNEYNQKLQARVKELRDKYNLEINLPWPELQTVKTDYVHGAFRVNNMLKGIHLTDFEKSHLGDAAYDMATLIVSIALNNLDMAIEFLQDSQVQSDNLKFFLIDTCLQQLIYNQKRIKAGDDSVVANEKVVYIQKLLETFADPEQGAVISEERKQVLQELLNRINQSRERTRPQEKLDKINAVYGLNLQKATSAN